MPTVIKIPANTAAGICEAIGPMAKRIKSNSKPAIIPERRVFPPELILTTVRMVAPAPGIPPNSAPKLFPIP